MTQDLQNFIFGQYKIGEDMEDSPILYKSNDNAAKLQFCGWAIILLPDGTYYLDDTTGG